jgi:hypothetical protein
MEPDEKMAAQLRQSHASGRLPVRCGVHCGILADLLVERKFTTIIYIDVLEHIEDDQRELNEAAAHLLSGGRIIVLGPAWPHLYSPFDHNIGHHRRYTKGSLKVLHLDGLQVETAFYLDSIGYLASLANKTMLKQSMPTTRQIIVWDRFMVPVSRVLDPLIF